MSRVRFALVALVASMLGCGDDPTLANVRSLEASGEMSFICLGGPGLPSPLYPVEACNEIFIAEETFGADLDVDDFGSDQLRPHLYALVTQGTRGEVAVIDMTAASSNVIDQDPSTPGDNAIPVGAQPVAIVSTPGSTASFVATAELTRPAIYALSSTAIRPCEIDASKCDTPAPTLTSWPACLLPAAPSDMILVADGDDGTGTRATCDGARRAPEEPIEREGKGRQKLVVSMPSLATVAVIDADAVLALPSGQLPACPIERSITLQSNVTPTMVPPPPPGPACVVPDYEPPGPLAPFRTTPMGMAFDGERLFMGDRTAPVVHVVAAKSPCEMTELDPLLPRSIQDPERIVTTTSLSVSQPIAPNFDQYLYAVDELDKSVMVFDVGSGGIKTPIVRPNAERNPFTAPDRIRFAAAPEHITVITRDAPQALPASGVAPFGTRCSPAPNAPECNASTPDCDPGTLYRTDTTDYEDGAGPDVLRGTFAVVALSSGEVAVIDVDDYDAACRAPATTSLYLGCDSEGGTLTSSNEATCNVIEPHSPRSAEYVISNPDVGRHVPGIQTFPNLTTEEGTVIPVEDPTTLRIHAPTPSTPVMPGTLTLAVAGDLLPIDDGTGFVLEDLTIPRNGVRMNLESLRTHVDQTWNITYEGIVPALSGAAGDLRLAASGSGEESLFFDGTKSFCGGGVSSRAAVLERLIAENDPAVSAAQREALATAMADRIVIAEEVADEDNIYWNKAACTYEACLASFGEDSLLRDMTILEAYDDHLVITPPPETVGEMIECCFPTLVKYEVRPGSQWTVVGSASGFLHHVIADPSTGVCRDSCDPRLARMNGRARTTTAATLPDNSPAVFANPMFSFLIGPGAEGVVAATPARDARFSFITQGGFVPLRVPLTNRDRPSVTPRAIRYLPGADHFFFSDGGLEGVIAVSGTLSGSVFQFF